jgi:hypothetical protein
MIHTRYGLDFDELYKLVLGKIHWKKCPCCDNSGTVYLDSKTGEGESSSPSGIDPEWLDRGSCENCNGLGLFCITIENGTQCVKKVYALQAKQRGISTFDRIGGISY